MDIFHFYNEMSEHYFFEKTMDKSQKYKSALISGTVRTGRQFAITCIVNIQKSQHNVFENFKNF